MRASGRRVVVALGAAGLAAGAAFAFAPGLVPAAVRGPAESAVESTDTSAVAAGVALLGLLAVLWRVRSSDGDAASEPLTATEPEAATTDTAVAGRSFDEAVERAGERDVALGGLRGGEPAVRLRETATAVLSRTRPDADAAALVATGAWTDDRVAAAFLGDERSPEWTFGERLRAWLAPERETERRARRALAALRRELDRYERRWHERTERTGDGDGTGRDVRDDGRPDGAGRRPGPDGTADRRGANRPPENEEVSG